MSSKKGKFVYQSNYKATPTLSPRKRKRGDSIAQSGLEEGEESEDEFDQLLVQALDNYEATQDPQQSTQDPLPCTPDPAKPTPYVPPLVTPSKAPRQQEEDKVMTMEGENSLLRMKLYEAQQKLSEKERQSVHETQKVKDQQRKEIESLKADLVFKNQEILNLQEKCRNFESLKLEQQHSRPLLSNGTSGKSKTEFVSTETFIPSSQVSGSKITQVTSTNRKKRSRSTSHAQSATSHTSSISKSISRGSQTDLNNISKVYQTLPSREINGAQLMRLLLQRNLLTIPDYKALEAKLHDNSNDDETQEEVQDLSEPLGLLSLLPVPTTSSPFVASTPTTQGSNFLVTPVNRRCTAVKPLPPKKTTPNLPLQPGPSFTADKVTSTPRDTPPINQTFMSSLEHSFASLLKSADLPSNSSLSSNTKMPHFSFDTLSRTALKTLESTTSDNGVSLLASFESILDNYLQEQILRRKRQNSLDKPVSSIKGGRVTIDSSSSGLSSGSNSSQDTPPTQPSHSSSDDLSQDSLSGIRFFDQSQTPSSLHQKKQVLQVGLSLETLCKYSRQVREAIFNKPPQFNRSALDFAHRSTPLSEEGERGEGSSEEDDMELGKVKDVCDLFKSKTTSHSESTHHKIPEDMIPLSYFLGDAISNRVYIKKDQVDPDYLKNVLTPPSLSNVGATTGSKRSMYAGNIFDVLIGLVHNLLWEEDIELLCCILESLTVLARECTQDCLDRYADLFKRESVLVSLLLLENPEVTLRVVALAIPLVRSTELVKLFCNNTSLCPLDHFYALFVPRAVVSSISLRTKIEQHLTILIYQLTLCSEGEEVLYESECCSHQLLKSLSSSLLNVLDDLESDELKEDTINRNKRTRLAESMVRLLHVICNKDKLIDEHKSECYHVFLTAISKSHTKLKGSGVEELLLDLLECEGVIEEEEEEEEGENV